MTRIEARALLDDAMKALASLLKLKKLTLTNASHAFRKKLDEGHTNIPTSSSSANEIKVDDARREIVLEGLLGGMITELTTPGRAQTLVPPEYSAALLRSLRSILASKATMEALSQRNHIIRSEGNDSAHSILSLTKIQARLNEDENHPLGEESKTAMKVLVQLFIDIPCLLPKFPPS